jgi:4-hydroxybenzoate polyprenyltransferase
MLFIKKLFDFYIKSSFHLGVCVVSLYIISIYKLEIDLNYYILTCLFSSTIVVYNFIKYASTLPYYFFVQNAPIKKIQIVSFFFGFFLLYSLFFLSFEALFFGFFLFLICVLYVFPINHSISNFRNRSKIKIFLVAICWSGSTVIFPFIESNNINYGDSMLLFVQFFLFVIVCTVPFEIRDLKYDSNDLKTIPQIYGTNNSKYISYVLIFIFFSISFISNGTSIDLISDLLISFVLVFIIYLTKENQGKYFSSFWVESLPIYWLIIQFILFNRIV